MPDRAPFLLPRTRVEVNHRALAQNINELRGLTSDSTKFMAVIKANAYGHGAVPVAKTALDNGADFLAVVRISEAVELRQANIHAPILLFGEVFPDQVSYLADHDIRATLVDLETAKNIALEAEKLRVTLKVHIKVDTGMGRLGLQYSNHGQSIENILDIHSLNNLEVEGIYTHLAKADETDKTHALEQLNRFTQIKDQLAVKGLKPELIHGANSAGLIDLPGSHFNMVRPGIALYGLWPSKEVDHTQVDLIPAMSIKSQIIQIKKVPPGFTVSYGATHITQVPTTIATIPIGYADGYSRLLSNKGQMLVHGQKAPVIGRVCMDFTMIDVGHIPAATLGDEVVIMGCQGSNHILADDIARATGTINYEITAGLTRRMPLCHTHFGETPHAPV